MPTMIGTLTRAAGRRPGEPLNILTFPTHERYESGLALTGHNFFAVRGPGIKDWNATYAPVPKNYRLLDPALGQRQVPAELDFDLVLSQNKFGQYAVALQLSRQLLLPLVSLEHTLPAPSWGEGRKASLRGMRGHIDVFISEYSRREWGFADGEAVVIHHGVDTETFKPDGRTRDHVLLSVVNDWQNRDWCCGFELWKEATAGLPVRVLGDTPGLSRPARNVKELADAYRASAVFVNTSLVSPVPSALLEAMASGCAVVSTPTCMIPEIVTHGENGLLAADAAGIRSHAERLLADPDLAGRLGAAARETVLAKFSMGNFVRNWDAVLRTAAGITYTRHL